MGTTEPQLTNLFDGLCRKTVAPRKGLTGCWHQLGNVGTCATDGEEKALQAFFRRFDRLARRVLIQPPRFLHTFGTGL